MTEFRCIFSWRTLNRRDPSPSRRPVGTHFDIFERHSSTNKLLRKLAFKWPHGGSCSFAILPCSFCTAVCKGGLASMKLHEKQLTLMSPARPFKCQHALFQAYQWLPGISLHHWSARPCASCIAQPLTLLETQWLGILSLWSQVAWNFTQDTMLPRPHQVEFTFQETAAGGMGAYRSCLGLDIMLGEDALPSRPMMQRNSGHPFVSLVRFLFSWESGHGR